MSTRIINESYEIVPIDQIRPHPRNPRQGDVGAIQQSIEANGFYGACVVQRSTGHILAGNHRWKGARAAGEKTIPVTWVDCDDDRALRILLADNRTSDIASYDDNALAELLRSIQLDTGTLLGTGFDGEALDELLEGLGLGGGGTDGLTDEDATPEPPEAPVTILGDLWLLGSYVECPHCGAKTDV